jgi:hypothetical protein
MASSCVSTIPNSCAMWNAHCSSSPHACAPLGLPLHTSCHTIVPNRLLMMMLHSKQHLIRAAERSLAYGHLPVFQCQSPRFD